MMTQEQLAAVAMPLPALTKDANGKAEVNLAVDGNAILFEIPSWMAGRVCDFTAFGCAVDVLEGPSTVDCVYNQVTTITSGALVTHAKTGRKVVDGTTKSWRVALPTEATHMSIEASGSGRICISPNSDPVRRA